ncbi:hypothetical protein SO802_022825 [Lithocarpus litseifolius]|uniref:Uncharacterized protein n=1 Tax=Lithocarpus litseifolius TaxID=425828 RepID=A0AAW2C6W1_9ROSI
MAPSSRLQLSSRPITWPVFLSHSTPSQLQQCLSSFQEAVFGRDVLHNRAGSKPDPSKGREAELLNERELLNWSRPEHCEFEDKREEKDDGECKKSKESRHKT